MALPSITATGNIAVDPVLRFNKNGDPVLGFLMICNERRKDDNGNWVDGKNLAINVSVWRTAAEDAAENLIKGDQVTVVGRISTRDYTDANGDTKRVIDLDADTIAKTFGRRKPAAPAAEVHNPFSHALDEEPF